MKYCVMLPVLLGICSAQTPARPAFEVVTVKRNTSGDTANGFDMLPSGIFRATNIQVSALVRFAYDVSDQTFAGAPEWLNSDRYDVSAKAQAGIAYAELRPLLQSMLADEFKLAVHREPKMMNAYALVVTKNPPKLQPAAAEKTGCIPAGPQGPDAGGRHVQCGNMSMQEFAHTLPNLAPQYITQPVVDQTGLARMYDFRLDWQVAAQIDAAGGVTIFGALEKIGLKLESKKLAVPVLVIDHIEKPAAN
jgi:bla regulator protein blaR1